MANLGNVMIYALGPFRLDTHDHLLFRGTEPLALGRRAIALLRALVEQPGALVSKDALIEAAWPGQAVEESNLTVQIAALRKVLGAVPGGSRWIETMPRRGYRFTAPVVADGISPPAPQPRADAERRQITAMSCELIAASGDAVGLDDLRDAIAAFQRSVARTADRHGGFVADHLGNAALVLFGYPVAQEHDAEQAVRAGLALCAAVGTAKHSANAPMHCRVGITTGMAIIGDLSRGEHREIVGVAPSLAVQLRLAAQPGIVAIEPATRRLIGGLFECRDLGTIDAGTDPVRAWRVLGETVTVSRFEALRGPALTRLVGREEETSLLLRLWSRAMAGEGQVVLVAGEAGIGKSRLTQALQESLSIEPHFILRYFCSPHHQDSPLYPFVDQLGRAAGFMRDDTPASRVEKLQALAARADLPDEDVAFLLDLLVLPVPEGQSLPNLTPARKKQRILDALSRYLEGLARQQPVVVIFEDAHWIDATSRELLDMLVGRAHDLKTLLLITFRPEFHPSWAGQPRVTLVALSRLDRRDRIALVALISGKALPDAVIEQIVDRTDGVPLFVEELTKSVLESGLLRIEADRYVIDGPLPSLAIPTSLYASLLARLDRQKSAQLAAQIGAAIGREFSYGLLQAVWALPEDELQAAVARLVTSELVYQRGSPPDAVYSFKHALVRDAAYGSLLRDSRQKLHALIAAALQAQSAELLTSQPELFAWHYAEAGLVEQSVDFWAKAGRRSAARATLAEAAAHFQKGLDQLALLPETAERLQQQLEFCSALGAALRAAKGLAAPETGRAYTRALALWESLGSPTAFVEIPFGLARYHAYRGEVDLALRLDDGLLHLSRQRNDSVGLILGHLSSGRTLMYAGRFDQSRAHLEDLLAIHDPASHRSVVDQVGFYPQGNAQACLAVVLLCLGYPEQALAQSHTAVAAARSLGHVHSLVSILALAAAPLALVGDQAGLGEWADQLVAITTEQSFPAWCAIGTTYRGWGKVAHGDADDGLMLLRNGATAFRVTGSELFAPFLMVLLASACASSGLIEESQSLLAEASQITERTGERWLAAELHRQQGELLLRQGNIAGAEASYRTALTIAVEQRAKFWELRAAVSLAQLRCEQGRRGDGRDVLAPVYGWFTEGFDNADLLQAKALLDQLA